MKQAMRITYRNKAAEMQFNPAFRKNWRYPKAVVDKVLAAENYIRNADSLLVVANYPPFHFHRLKGSRKDEWSIYLGNTGYRLVIIPCDENDQAITEGDVLALARSIKVIMVVEVSNHYE